MDRMACVDIRALPLQVLLRNHPQWTGRPVVVVDRDKPQGIIQWANEPARAYRILPGMRYAAGLALCRGLHGGAVSPTELDETVALIGRRLWRFSPRIEPAEREPGVFWLDASGLRHVYPSLEAWIASIRDDLRDTGFHAVIAVGFSRFACYAAAKAATRNLVFQTPEHEREHLRRVPIDRIEIEPHVRDTLLKLGIDTLGAFSDLPPEAIHKRFGPEAADLHRWARGNGWKPLQPSVLLDPPEHATSFDEYPETDVDRLLAVMEGMLEALRAELAERHEALKSLHLALRLDDRREHHEEIAPATPTRDLRQLTTLIRLRLDTLALSAGVVDLTLRATGAPIGHRQLDLFREAPRRTLDGAHKAFAKIRAQLGNNAIVCAHLTEGHLPKASYRWDPLRQLSAPNPAPVACRPLVRRIYTPPVELPPRDRHEPDGWLIAGVAEGPVEEVLGPYFVSGGWWLRETARAYHYVRTRSGRWLWIYHDQKRRRWFLQGEVQ